MAVGRNDLCPCGSGKKYKKCCLKKDNVVELASHRREQFYLDKQQLVEKIGGFLKQQIPFQEYNQLKNEFLKRTDHQIQEDAEESFYTFWLFFYHHFDHGMRGVEWFYEENGKKLDVKQKEMLERWIAMRPRFLQAINVEKEAVIFEDTQTKEQFPLSAHAENIEHIVPWISTFAMIEEFDGLYYFNGFWMSAGPNQLQYAETTAQELMTETGLNEQEVMVQYFPEITAALINQKRDSHGAEREVYQYTQTYSIENDLFVLEFLRSRKDFNINKWENDTKELVWAGNWRVYHDSECDLPVKLADVLGTITVKDKNRTLTFQTMQEEHGKNMKQELKELGNKLKLVKDDKELIGTSNMEAHNVMVSMDKTVPQYFALYAQNDLFYEAEQPIPMYDGHTLRELMNQGEVQKVETWLRNAEFGLYKQILNKEEQVDITADFNGIRKDMGLELSPFVTGGVNRQSQIESIEPEDNGPRLLEEDIPFLEELGFKPETIDQFYTGDFIRFYKERTIGKSDNTKRKYRQSLDDLRAILEQKTLFRWEQCDQSFWKQVIIEDYPKLFEDSPSKTGQKDFLNTLKMFLTWMDKIGQTSMFQESIALIQEQE